MPNGEPQWWIDEQNDHSSPLIPDLCYWPQQPDAQDILNRIIKLCQEAVENGEAILPLDILDIIAVQDEMDISSV